MKSDRDKLKEAIKKEIRSIDQTVCLEADYEYRLEEIAEGIIKIIKAEQLIT